MRYSKSQAHVRYRTDRAHRIGKAGTGNKSRGYRSMTKHLLDVDSPEACRAVRNKEAQIAPDSDRPETIMLKTIPAARKRKSPRPTFITLDRFRVKKLGVMVTVELDRDTDDFAHLIGKKIVIDGKMEVCFSVERLPHAPPLKKGERVSLLIRKG